MFDPKLPTGDTKSGNESYFNRQSRGKEYASGTLNKLS